MNLVCRRVDSEYADCTRCGKKLTLRALAYNHAKTCKAYDDRVAKRTAQAHENYHRKLKNLRGESAYEDSLDEDPTMTSTPTTFSENSALDMSVENASSSAFSNTSTGRTKLTSNQHTSEEKTHEVQTGITVLNKSDENAAEGQFKGTFPVEKHEKTDEGPFQITSLLKNHENTFHVTNGCKKTQVITPGITFEGKKTLRVTPEFTLPPAFDNKITGMFQYIHMLS